jgi:hypothetical protein
MDLAGLRTTPAKFKLKQSLEDDSRVVSLATKQPIQLFTNGLVAQSPQLRELLV